MRYLLTTVVALLMALPLFSQNDSGIFLAVKCSKGSAKQTSLINHKQVCLAQNPIILSTEFVSITDVQTLGDRIWFDLVLSQKAVKTISQLSANLPSSGFALVVDKQVFSTFAASEITANRTFRFQGISKDHSIFTDIQMKLKSLIVTATK